MSLYITICDPGPVPRGEPLGPFTDLELFPGTAWVNVRKPGDDDTWHELTLPMDSAAIFVEEGPLEDLPR
jgi:hypothetical protein